MKNFISFLLILCMAILSHCKNEEIDAMDHADRVALAGMEDAYAKAKEAIDSLRVAVGAGMDDIHIRSYDSLFHMHLDNFNMLHSNYSHHNAHDDHYHNQQGMHMNGMMGSNHMEWEDGHHAEDHELMKDLIHEHDQFHLH